MGIQKGHKIRNLVLKVIVICSPTLYPGLCVYADCWIDDLDHNFSKLFVTTKFEIEKR